MELNYNRSFKNCKLC